MSIKSGCGLFNIRLFFFPLNGFFNCDRLRYIYTTFVSTQLFGCIFKSHKMRHQSHPSLTINISGTCWLFCCILCSKEIFLQLILKQGLVGASHTLKRPECLNKPFFFLNICFHSWPHALYLNHIHLFTKFIEFLPLKSMLAKPGDLQIFTVKVTWWLERRLICKTSNFCHTLLYILPFCVIRLISMLYHKFLHTHLHLI